MPADTHQIIQDLDTDTFGALLQVLLDPPEGDESGIVTLADLGIDDGGALDLCQAVCEEFGERTLGSEIDPDLFDLTVTAVTAAAELTNGCHHGL